MLLKTRHIFRFNRPAFHFSPKGKPPKHKVQTVGFVNDHIENVKTLSHKLSAPLQYTDGECLVYKSHYSLSRTLRDYWIHLTAMTSFSYCLLQQVNFTTYPIIKHVYVAGLAISNHFFDPGAFMTARRFLRNHAIVKEIYLLEGGKATKVIYQNAFKRKIFGQQTEEIYYNSIFARPRQQEEKSLLTHWDFPEECQQITKEAPIYAYWRKRFRNKQNNLLIPTNYDYMHAEVMVNLMKGKTIIF